ncbi:hypothetical protein D3C80_1319900 [compost metagenome]
MAPGAVSTGLACLGVFWLVQSSPHSDHTPLEFRVRMKVIGVVVVTKESQIWVAMLLLQRSM